MEQESQSVKQKVKNIIWQHAFEIKFCDWATDFQDPLYIQTIFFKDLTVKNAEIIQQYCKNIKSLWVSNNLDQEVLIHLGRIRTLETLYIKCQVSIDIRYLKHLHNLKELNIQTQNLNIEQISVILPQLQHIGSFLFSSSIIQNKLQSLKNFKKLTKLKGKKYSSFYKNYDFLKRIDELIPNLQYLYVQSCYLDDNHMLILSKTISNLKGLWIGHNTEITDIGIQYLLVFQDSLIELQIQKTSIKQKGLQLICNSFTKLQKFKVMSSLLTKNSLQQLIKNLNELTNFYLLKDDQTTSDFQKSDMVEFVASKKSLSLLGLWAFYSNLLCKCLYQKQLKIKQLMLLSHPGLNDSGVFYLCKIKYLRKIHIGNNHFSDFARLKIGRNLGEKRFIKNLKKQVKEQQKIIGFSTGLQNIRRIIDNKY